MTLAEPVFMAFVIFSSPDKCKEFAEYYDLARIFEPQCVEMGGEADYRRPWPDVRPQPRPTQESRGDTSACLIFALTMCHAAIRLVKA
jgi:hypothetical protein